MISSAQDGNFSKSSSLPSLFLSSAWVVGFVCNCKLLILLLISPFQLGLSPFRLSYTVILALMYMLQLWDKLHIYLQLWGQLPKMSFIDNSGLWKYCLRLNSICWVRIVATTGRLIFQNVSQQGTSFSLPFWRNCRNEVILNSIAAGWGIHKLRPLTITGIQRFLKAGQEYEAF